MDEEEKATHEKKKKKASTRSDKTAKAKGSKQQHTNGGGAAAQTAIPWPGKGAKALDYARYYLGRNWKPVSTYKMKEPIHTNWQKQVITLENVHEHFHDPMNVGVQLGVNGLVDNDLDCEEAVALAEYFLPPTSAIFGRASKPKSHWLHHCEDLPVDIKKATLQTKDDKGSMIVELRIGAGGKGAQTIFPALCTQMVKSSPGTMSLVSRVMLASTSWRQTQKKLACAALLLRHWPAKRHRHETAFTVGAFLARAGWERDDVANIIHAVCTTYSSPTADKHVQSALPKLRQHPQRRPDLGPAAYAGDFW